MSVKKYLLTELEISELCVLKERIADAMQGIPFADVATPVNEYGAFLGAHEYTERTCHIEELDEDGYPVPDSVCGDGFCGACQGIIDIEDAHCKHCGAKLVEQ